MESEGSISISKELKRADPLDIDLGNEFDLVDSRRLYIAQSVLGIAL